MQLPAANFGQCRWFPLRHGRGDAACCNQGPRRRYTGSPRPKSRRLRTEHDAGGALKGTSPPDNPAPPFLQARKGAIDTRGMKIPRGQPATDIRLIYAPPSWSLCPDPFHRGNDKNQNGQHSNNTCMAAEQCPAGKVRAHVCMCVGALRARRQGAAIGDAARACMHAYKYACMHTSMHARSMQNPRRLARTHAPTPIPIKNAKYAIVVVQIGYCRC